MLALLILVILLALMFVGMPFLLIGVLHLFSIDVPFIPALVTYIAILLASNIFKVTKN